MMTIQDLGAIGEILGGVAVFATLVYLSVQVRQANRATHRGMYAQAATAISDFWLALAKDHALYDSFRATLRDQESQSEVDRDRGFLVMDSYLSLMESYYLHNREYGETLSQERWGRIMQRMFETPGGRKYWQARRSSFHTEFAAYVDGLI